MLINYIFFLQYIL